MSLIDHVKLGTISEIITKGTTPTTLGYDFQREGINFLKVECFDETGRFIPDKVAFISRECNEKLKRSQLKKGDILFSIAGAIGRVSVVTENMLPANTNQALAIIRIKEDNLYLPYIQLILNSQIVKRQLEKKKQGVAQLNISLKDVSELTIPIPQKETQIKYAKLFEKISMVIRNRKKQLKKFDELIKARFVEMFGTYPKNEKGWKVGKIRDLVSDVRYGSSRKAAEGNCGHYQYLRMNNITYSGELDLSEVKTIDIPKDELEKCTVKRGDLLFNRTNSKELVGKTCVYNRDEQMVLAGFIVRVRMNDKALPEFVSAFMNTDFSKQMLLGMCKTAIGQANINAQELQNIGIYIPPIKIQKEFIEFKAQIDKSKVVVPSKIKNTIFAIMLSVSFGQITSI